MAPSAPLPLPPPAPLTAFLEVDGTEHASNGHTLPDDILRPSLPKLPSKSSLKTHSMFGGQQQQQLNQASIRHSVHGVHDNGALDQKMMDKNAPDARGPNLASGNGADVTDSDADYIPCKRKDSRVTWTDSQGKDLAEVWEFEPSDSGDSDDEESDSESSQACTCVIQ